MTIGDLIKNKDYDYVSYRLTLDGDDTFAGCFSSKGGEIISLDGDIYDKDKEVLSYEEWSSTEDNVQNGLTVVVKGVLMFVERKDYNKVITVKLVIPGGCNAKCPFCYNKDKRISSDKQQFLENFIDSLDDIICRIGDKNPISVDITGGEPTLDPELLAKVLIKLKQYDIKSKVLRTTITTNGTNLKEVIPFMKGVIDYVNISIHDWRPFRRENILGFCITEIQYKDMIKALNDIGITVSACAVIYKKIPNFVKWRDFFIDWAKEVGFISVRFRCDVFWKESDVFDTYLIDSKNDTTKFDVIDYENTTDSHWCRLRRKDKMRVFFLHGVLDTSLKTKGIEYVIDDDGHCYCDYYKRTKIEDYEYEVGKIYDWIDSKK